MCSDGFLGDRTNTKGPDRQIALAAIDRDHFVGPQARVFECPAKLVGVVKPEPALHLLLPNLLVCPRDRPGVPPKEMDGPSPALFLDILGEEVESLAACRT